MRLQRGLPVVSAVAKEVQAEAQYCAVVTCHQHVHIVCCKYVQSSGAHPYTRCWQDTGMIWVCSLYKGGPARQEWLCCSDAGCAQRMSVRV